MYMYIYMEQFHARVVNSRLKTTRANYSIYESKIYLVVRVQISFV